MLQRHGKQRHNNDGLLLHPELPAFDLGFAILLLLFHDPVQFDQTGQVTDFHPESAKLLWFNPILLHGRSLE